MARITKRESGKWRADVCKSGVRLTKTLDSKTAALAWASKAEAELSDTNTCKIKNKSFGELLDEYALRVSTTKKGERWEVIRIGLFKRDPIAEINLRVLNSSHFAEWRDRRLEQVSALSVRREWALLSHALNIAIKEWRWLEVNPMTQVKKPKPPPSRDRLISQDEIDRLMLVFGSDVNTVMGRVGQAFLFAIETALRAGEIVSLNWNEVHLEKRFITVLGGKTDSARRDVPLTSEAIRILEGLKSEGSVFNLNSSQIDSLFRKAKAKAMVEGLHFHDTRAEAITRLAQKLDILTLARMVGHRDLRMLQVYYRESAEESAKKLL